jgi:preprotein translocase subunit SecE
VANKEQTKALQPKKNEEKAVLDKKNQPVVAKAKKPQASGAQPKKRSFTFFSDIIGELKKVVWPTRQETVRLTLIVIGLCVFMGLILGAVDYGFSELVAKVFLGGK